jgi:hypothetical protein
VHSWKSLVALTLLVALLAPVVALARAYQTFTVDVPFEFTIGERKFKPGTYIFVILGPGLIALENGKKHVITTLVTRDIRAADDTASPHMYFENRKGHKHLASIWMGNGGKGLEVVGEQVAMRQNEAPPSLLLLPEGPRFKIPNTMQEK